MKTHRHTRRTAIVAAALCLMALPAAAVVGLYSSQTYGFFNSDAQSAWVARYNYDADELNWHGPYAPTSTFSVTFDRSPYEWIGLFTYSTSAGSFQRVYYLFYDVV